MTVGWSDLQAYWECPRRWWYERQGWRPAQLPQAMLQGLWVHLGLSEHWESRDGASAIWQAAREEVQDASSQYRDLCLAAADEAVQLTARILRYLEATDLEPFAGECRLEYQGCRATLDGMGLYQGKLALLEVKTGESASIEAVSQSGQADYYGVVARNALGKLVPLAAFIVATNHSLTHLVWPLDTAKGLYLAEQVRCLGTPRVPEVLAEPHYSWWCTRCPFLSPCQVYDQGGDHEDILYAEYLREARK